MRIILLLILNIFFINASVINEEVLKEWQSMNDYFFDKQKNCKVELCINGRVFEFIDIAFNDYIKLEKGNLRKRKYYSFFLTEERGGIVVSIAINNRNIYQDYNRTLIGGGADYLIDKKSKKILDFAQYK